MFGEVDISLIRFRINFTMVCVIFEKSYIFIHIFPCAHQNFGISVPFRTFKTKRDSEAAKEGNPNLFARIKNKLFPSRLNNLNVANSPSTMTSDKLKGIK